MSIRSERKKKRLYFNRTYYSNSNNRNISSYSYTKLLAIQRKARIQADVETGKNLFDATSALIAENKIKQPLKRREIKW